MSEKAIFLFRRLFSSLLLLLLMVQLAVPTIQVSAQDDDSSSDEDTQQTDDSNNQADDEEQDAEETSSSSSRSNRSQETGTTSTATTTTTSLANVLRLPVCEDLRFTTSPVSLKYQPFVGDLAYAWADEPEGATRSEFLTFDISQGSGLLPIFQLVFGGNNIVFSWQGVLDRIRTQNLTDRASIAGVNPFALSQEQKTYNAIAVFYDSAGRPICRSSNNNWLRTLVLDGTPLVCGSSNLNDILSNCSFDNGTGGTEVAQGTSDGGTTGGGGNNGGGGNDADGDGISPPLDCNDNDPNINPLAPDTTVDGIDQNCDGTDGPVAPVDNDNDNYSPPADCNDNDPNINPGAPDTTVDGVDQNCDGTDGPLPPVDNDNDNYSPPADCNDNDPNINPGAPDTTVDGIDQNCDGTDGPVAPVDNDNDNYYVPGIGITPDDCNDNDPNVYPGAPGDVVGDFIDTDCDGTDGPSGDIDGDSIPDLIDACPNQPGVPYGLDPAANGCPDSDSDTIPDVVDACFLQPGISYPSDPDGNGCPDNDANGGPDGVPDVIDNCPMDNNPSQDDLDNDGDGDACDPIPNGCGDPHVVDILNTDPPPGLPNETVNGPNYTAVECADYDLDVYGSSANNIINGGNGDDYLRGFGGNDQLNGNAGDDTLDGGAGNDALNGGTGTDTAIVNLLDAGEDVTLNMNNGNGTATATGSAGTDTLSSIEMVVLNGEGGDNTFDVTDAGNDEINGAGGNDTLLVHFATGGTATFERDIFSGDGTATGLPVGNDQFTSIEFLNITGSSSSDVIVVSDAGSNIINGGSGVGVADTYDVSNNNNNNTLVSITGGIGLVTGLDVGADPLTSIENVNTGGGNDIFTIMDAGNNIFDANGGDDTYEGYMTTSGLVTITNTGSPATVVGAGIGTDQLFDFEFINIHGSGGDDDFVVNDNGSNTIDGAGGTDSYTLGLATNIDLTVDQDDANANEFVIDDTVENGLFGEDNLVDVEEITTSNGNDTFLINDLGFPSLLNAGGNTAAGDTFVYDNAAVVNILLTIDASRNGTADDGVDTVTLRDFENYTTAGGDDIFLIGDPGNNILDANGGVDTYDISTFATNAGDNVVINATSGNTTSSGALGTDQLFDFERIITGAGADLFQFDSLIGNGFLDANGNTDAYEFLGVGTDLLITHTTTSATTSTTTVFDGTLTDTLEDFENFASSDGDDTFNTTDTFGVNNIFSAGGNTAVGDTYIVNVASGTDDIVVSLDNGTGTAIGANIGTDSLFDFESIQTAGGNDNFTLLTTAPGFSYNFIATGDGDDNVTITDSGDNILDGEGGGGDILTIIVDSTQATNNIVLDRPGNTASGDGVGTDTVTNFERINLTGTEVGDETFNITDDQDQTVNGLGGSDTYVATGSTNTVMVFLDTNNDGTIDGIDTGSDDLFSIENVTTGTGDDVFYLEDSQGRNLDADETDAVADTDTYVYVPPGTAQDVTIDINGDVGTAQVGAGTPDNIFDFENFTTAAGNDTFNILDTDDNIIDANDGNDVVNVTMADDDLASSVEIARSGADVNVQDDIAGNSTGSDTYLDVEQVNITGTDDDDAFFVNDATTNNIDGAAGNDSYVASTTAANSPFGNAFDTIEDLDVNLDATNSGTISDQNIGAPTFETDNLTSVENVTTGTGDDNFTVASIDNRTLDANGQVDAATDSVDTDSYTYTGTADTTVAGSGDDLTITDNGTANVDNLENFENITTSTGDDTFSLQDTTGRILDAGGNTAVGDTYEFDGVNGTVTLDDDISFDDGGGTPDTLLNFENYATGTNNDTIVFDIYLDQIDEFYELDVTNTTSNVTLNFYNSTFDNPDTEIHGIRLIGSDTTNVTFDFSSPTITHNVNIDTNSTDSQAIFGASSNFRLELASSTLVDNVYGTQQSDVIVGNDQDNIINGNDGNDIITGGGGNDTLDGGNGIDTIDESQTTLGVDIDLNAGTASGSEIGNDTLANFENIIGGEGNDNLTGNALNNTIEGNGGIDTIEGLGGNDILHGGAGNDIIYGGTGNDTIDGQQGADLIYGGTNNEGLADGNDNITDTGTDGGDTIYGGNNNLSTSGIDGNDSITFVDAAAPRTVYGGNNNVNAGCTEASCADGNDTITDTSSAGDIIYGGNNNLGGDGNDVGDTINITPLGGNGNTVHGDNNNSAVGTGDGGADTINVVGSDNNDIYGGNQNLSSGNTDTGNTILLDDSSNNTVYGGNDNQAGANNDDTGADTITVTGTSSGNDIYGGNNNLNGTGVDSSDTLTNVGAGNNTIYGGNNNTAAGCTGATCADGSDTILDTSGDNDTLYGGNYNATGSAGNDGNDSFTGVSSNDTVYGGNYNNGGTGTDGSDNFTNVGDNTTIYGGNQNFSASCTGGACDDAGDTISGITGNSTLYGGNQNQVGDGNDVGTDSINVISGGNTVYGGNQNTPNGTGDDGDDTISIVPSADAGNTVYGGNQNNSAACGITGTCDDGDDTITDNSPFPDTIYGGNQNLNGTGNDGDDTISTGLSGTGGNTIYGGNQNNGGLGTDGGDTINDSNNVGDTIYGGNKNSTPGCNGTNCADNGDDIITIYFNALANGNNLVYGGNNNTGSIGGNDAGNDYIRDLSEFLNRIYAGNNNFGGATGDDTGNNEIDTSDADNPGDEYCLGNSGSTGGDVTGANTVSTSANDTVAVDCDPN